MPAEGEMKLFFMFDASVSGYEIKNEISFASGWPGMRSVQLLEKVSGDGSHFCAEIDVADDKAEEVRNRVRGLQSQYAGYVYGLKEISYRTI